MSERDKIDELGIGIMLWFRCIEHELMWRDGDGKRVAGLDWNPYKNDAHAAQVLVAAGERFGEFELGYGIGEYDFSLGSDRRETNPSLVYSTDWKIAVCESALKALRGGLWTV